MLNKCNCYCFIKLNTYTNKTLGVFSVYNKENFGLKKELYATLDTDSIRRWLAVSLYSSEFSVTPSTRTEEKCQVHLFDEAKQIISTVSILLFLKNYINLILSLGFCRLYCWISFGRRFQLCSSNNKTRVSIG